MPQFSIMEYTVRKMEKNEVPKPLLEIPQPPSQLFIAGTLPDTHIYVSVVGSRRYTEYGERCCRELIDCLAGKSATIVSGLAYGIDTIAHRAALAAKLPTIAVPGSGLDRSVLYPRAHTQLADEIIYHGGCLISEFDPFEKAAPWMFPQRNRIMAGISRATLIIEAEEKSGTLITARLAADYNRDVLAVPGSIFSAASVGTNFLLRQGVTPITCRDDLLDALGLLEDNRRFPFKKLSPLEMEVVSLLTASPCTRNEIVRFTKKPFHEICATLSLLEMKGIITEKLGQLWLA